LVNDYSFLLMNKLQVLEFQQRKCSVIFDLSCNLARILEFCTREIPQAFLLGNDMNIRRLTELVIFTLNQMTSTTDSEFFDWYGISNAFDLCLDTISLSRNVCMSTPLLHCCLISFAFLLVFDCLCCLLYVLLKVHF